jgi:dethiobiotin synthetase
MPDSTVLVAGTHTGVGKTWVTARAVAALVSRGFEVVARKPVQSFDPAHAPTDAELLGAATGEPPQTVCPTRRWYAREMAPPMAAAELGRPRFTVSDLVSELGLPATGTALIEAVGGPRSPLAEDGDTVTLAEYVDPDLVLLVAHAGLGVINAVTLSATPFVRWPLIVMLNRFDPTSNLHCLNRTWLRTCGFDIVVSAQEVADRLVRTLARRNPEAVKPQ